MMKAKLNEERQKLIGNRIQTSLQFKSLIIFVYYKSQAARKVGQAPLLFPVRYRFKEANDIKAFSHTFTVIGLGPKTGLCSLKRLRPQEEKNKSRES